MIEYTEEDIKRNRFVYVGPDIEKGPAYGECYNASSVAHMLENDIPLEHIMEMTMEEARTITELYKVYDEEFMKMPFKKQTDRRETKKLVEKVGLKDFVDSIAGKKKIDALSLTRQYVELNNKSKSLAEEMYFYGEDEPRCSLEQLKAEMKENSLKLAELELEVKLRFIKV